MMFTQELTRLCHAGIVLVLIKCRTVLFGINTHAAELINVEGTAEAPDALLLEDGRPAILALDGKIACQHQRREDDQTDCRDEKVDQALGVALKLVHPVADESRVVLIGV